jgi:hypothetical protein
MSTLRSIGYWRSEDEPEEAGAPLETYMGYSKCRICDRINGVGEFMDDIYLWPEGLAHYVGEHSVRLPQEVVEHILREVSLDPSVDVDRGWWRSIRPD